MMKIVSIKKIPYSGFVYNIETNPDHNYFVSPSKILVHNCYKSNINTGKNTSFEDFKKTIDKMPSILQVAFGIGDIDGNPDFFKMMEYCRVMGIVPNVTVNGFRLTSGHLDKLADFCGAVAVSNYEKSSCYGTVKALTDRGMKQINIHQLVAAETVDQIWDLISDYKTDDRLRKLNAIVFLSLKQRGRGMSYHKIDIEDFKKIIFYCLNQNIPFGFDSCTANKFSEVIKDDPRFHEIEKYIEPCESTLFSGYLNVESKFFPCSFLENGSGIDVLNCEDFLQDVWYNPETIEWRKKLLDNCRNCPAYNI